MNETERIAARAQLLERHTDEVRAIFTEACEVVREVIPDATEQVDLPDGLVAFGFGRPGGIRMRNLAIAVQPHSAHVNVQFADGATLPDPTGIMEGTGTRIRHVKCHSVADARRPALRELLRQQADLRRPS